MKKLYFLGFLGLAVAANAQNTSQAITKKTATATVKKNVDKVVTSPVQNPNPSQVSKPTSYNKTARSWDTPIGTTKWANQTSGTPYRRVIAYPDGKVSATWTASNDDPGLSRGSGYNHYNGSWLTPNGLRIEEDRAGFPSMSLSPDNKEIIMSHRVDTSGRSRGLIFNQNQGIGSQTWASNAIFTPTTTTQPSRLWPQSVVSGDYLIVVSAYQDSTDDQPDFVTLNGVRSPMVVKRYQFSTQTWLDEDSILPGYDATFALEGRPDTYSIDANGANVAIAVSDIFTSTAIWKSTNSGASWTKTMIDTFPVENFLFDRDTFPQTTRTDGSCNVLVDGNGMAHYFSGKATYQDTVAGDGSYVYTFSRFAGNSENTANDGILYWSEYDPTLRQIASTPAVDGDSAIQEGSFRNEDRRYEISVATWPSAGINNAGRIFVTFSSLTPGDMTSDAVSANYRDIYVISSADSGTTWTIPSNLTSHEAQSREEAFPTMAKRVDDNLHISYMLKTFPGLTGSGEVYEMHYLRMPVENIDQGTVSVKEVNNNLFSVSANYPNPFRNSTIIPVNLTQKADVTVTVMNILGGVVYTKTFDNTTSGVNQLEVNANFKTGFYMYTVEAGGFKASGKMLAE
jgi:hypothetical protein